MGEQEEEIVRLFGELDLIAAIKVYERVRLVVDAKRREALEAIRLLEGTLGPTTESGVSPSGKHPMGRRKPGARYRSINDPTKTWAGRGNMAGWLIKEMKETGLPMDAFVVRDDL